MEPKELIILIEKYELGVVSADELAVLEKYYASINHGQQLEIDPGRKELIRRTLEAKIGVGTGRGYHFLTFLKLYKRTAVAAAVLLITGISIFLFSYFFERDTGAGTDVYSSADIPPGGHRATLTLADGRTMELSSAHTGIVTKDGHITYQDGTTVLYPEQLADQEAALAQTTPYRYQLETPKGGTYALTLPDGTRVWLNAGSKLTYPDRFVGDERIVELIGEAYFEVVPDRRIAVKQSVTGFPFLVKTKNQIVKVLGTQFNISAYEDDSGEATTLVSGAVSLLNIHSGQETRLAPGQQGVVHNGKIQTRETDTAPFVVWKEGKFLYEGKTFEQIMKELSRWYDIDVKYEGAVPEVEFYGGGYRSSNLSLVLRMLQSADLHYRLEGKTLTISEQAIQ